MPPTPQASGKLRVGPGDEQDGKMEGHRSPALRRGRDMEQALAGGLQPIWDLVLGQGKGQKQALN